MAVNDTRSMNLDFHEGGTDSSYIKIAPDRVAIENPPLERLEWPQYRNAEIGKDHSHLEAHLRRSVLPVERKAVYGSDPRA